MRSEHFIPKGVAALMAAIGRFPNAHVAHGLFASMRWPDGVFCPECGSKNVRYLSDFDRYQCTVNHRRRQFTIKTGTIMEGSHIALQKWAAAFSALADGGDAISSHELHRALGISQKSAWSMKRRISTALRTGSILKRRQ